VERIEYLRDRYMRDNSVASYLPFRTLGTISEFWGEYRWLSNFWYAEVVLDGEKYPSVEHAYQAAKTLDEGWRERIRKCETPGEAKRLGRQVPIREDWERSKVGIMRNLLWQKFNHPLLKQKLLETGNCLIVEGNSWGDTFWGVCAGCGENMLGRLIMSIRSALQTECALAGPRKCRRLVWEK